MERILKESKKKGTEEVEKEKKHTHIYKWIYIYIYIIKRGQGNDRKSELCFSKIDLRSMTVLVLLVHPQLVLLLWLSFHFFTGQFRRAVPSESNRKAFFRLPSKKNQEKMKMKKKMMKKKKMKK